jgi:hypothetical protein
VVTPSSGPERDRPIALTPLIPAPRCHARTRIPAELISKRFFRISAESGYTTGGLPAAAGLPG